jgi:hypothetical protein
MDDYLVIGRSRQHRAAALSNLGKILQFFIDGLAKSLML